MMRSQKVVSPVKTGVQWLQNYLKSLNSGFRRNDENVYFETLCESKLYGSIRLYQNLSDLIRVKLPLTLFFLFGSGLSG